VWRRLAQGARHRARRAGRAVGRRARRWRAWLAGRRGRRLARLAAEGRANRGIDGWLRPGDLADVGAWIETGTLALERADYDRLLASAALARFRELPYAHAKPLEYLASLRALAPAAGEVLLDAAGGASGEYLRAARDFVGAALELVGQDALAGRVDEAGIRFVSGSVDRIALADASVDAIACHHSFEHFQGDLDTRFLGEALRLLRPGGRLAIVPLFLGSSYAEIWNRRPARGGDPRARRVVDRTAAFAGWGPFEGFARVYDAEALRARVLARLPAGARARLLRVTLDGRPAPDLAANRHQPAVNGEMKLLLVVAGDVGARST
jgi:SAM-dependent methyltransferase